MAKRSNCRGSFDEVTLLGVPGVVGGSVLPGAVGLPGPAVGEAGGMELGSEFGVVGGMLPGVSAGGSTGGVPVTGVCARDCDPPQASKNAAVAAKRLVE
jgi:hypothetical protein